MNTLTNKTMTNQTIKGYVVEGIYTSGESTCKECFETEVEAKNYYESLIVDLEEEKESIDYITIFFAQSEDNTEVEEIDELSVEHLVNNIETYTYD